MFTIVLNIQKNKLLQSQATYSSKVAFLEQCCVVACFHLHFCSKLTHADILHTKTDLDIHITPFRWVWGLDGHVFQHDPYRVVLSKGTGETAFWNHLQPWHASSNASFF